MLEIFCSTIAHSFCSSISNGFWATANQSITSWRQNSHKNSILVNFNLMLTYVDNVELVIKWYHRRVRKFLIPMVFKWWRSVKRFTSYNITKKNYYWPIRRIRPVCWFARFVTGEILDFDSMLVCSVCLSVCLSVCGQVCDLITQWVLNISSWNQHGRLGLD